MINIHRFDFRLYLVDIVYGSFNLIKEYLILVEFVYCGDVNSLRKLYEML